MVSHEGLQICLLHVFPRPRWLVNAPALLLATTACCNNCGCSPLHAQALQSHIKIDVCSVVHVNKYDWIALDGSAYGLHWWVHDLNGLHAPSLEFDLHGVIVYCIGLVG